MSVKDALALLQTPRAGNAPLIMSLQWLQIHHGALCRRWAI